MHRFLPARHAAWLGLTALAAGAQAQPPAGAPTPAVAASGPALQAPAVLPAPPSAPEAAPTASSAPLALQPVHVTARRNPDASTLTQPDLATARAGVALTPGGAGVVDAASYAGGRVATLADALGYAAGVSVQPRFGAEEARLSIRGSGLQRTFHGRGLKLMQDGVPLNLADGSFDFQAIEPLSARYVEVWRGANALQYGAATLGGAVNFVSPNGLNGDALRARLEGGPFGYRRGLLSQAGVHGRLDEYLAVSGFAQDGFREHARQESLRGFANLGWQLAPDLETRFYLGHVRSRSELPGSLTRAQLEDDPEHANAGNVALDQRRDIDWTRLSNKTVWRDGATQLEAFAYLADKRLHHPIFQVIDQDSTDFGGELRWVDERPLAGRRNRLVLGLAASEGRTDEERHENVAGDSGARTNASRQTARNLEAYAELQHELAPGVWAVGGLQGLRSTRKLEDRLRSGTPPVDEGFSVRYTGASPKLGLRVELTPQSQLFANVSRSLEPPSFGELAGGLRPVLNDAQRGTTVELGARGTRGGLGWDVALYDTRLRDELLQIDPPGATGASATVNAPHTRHRGLELGLAGEHGLGEAAGRFEWRAAGLWNDFRFDGDPTHGDARLPGLPRAALRAQAGWRAPGGTLIALQAEGASGYAVDFARSWFAKRYAIWGLRASGALGDGLSWFVDGRNLSDRRYAATTGVVRDARGADVAQFLPGDGRAVFAGLDWRLR
jgi:iron complex outermembrane receptor protein